MKGQGSVGMPICEGWEAAGTYRLPVLVDVVGQAAVVEMLASQYPDVNFIIPHLGSFRDDWRAHQQVVDQLVRYPNVYADTSGVRRFDYIVEAIRRAGPRKLLFGSDGPWLHPGVELHKIRLLGLRPEDEALVLGRNTTLLISGARAERRIAPPVPPSVSRSVHVAAPDARDQSLGPIEHEL